MSDSSHGESQLLKGVGILVVENDVAIARSIGVLLARHGADVRLASQAREALATLGIFQPRSVVVDLALPLMSGLVLARQLKAGQATREIVVIALSAFAGPEVERMALDAGCAACVFLPVDDHALVSAVARHVEAAA